MCLRAIPTGSSWRPKPGSSRMRQYARAANLRRFGRGTILLAAALCASFIVTQPLLAEDDDVTDPQPPVAGPIKFPDAQIEVADWKELEGWAADDHEAGFAAF